jgi:hypothetical protein
MTKEESLARFGGRCYPLQPPSHNTESGGAMMNLGSI